MKNMKIYVFSPFEKNVWSKWQVNIFESIDKYECSFWKKEKNHIYGASQCCDVGKQVQ